MHSITPRQLAKWEAYYEEEMDPLDRLIEICKRGFAAMLSTKEKPVDPKLLDPQMDDKKEKPVQQTPDQQAAMMGAGIRLVGGNVSRGDRDR